MHEVSIIQTYNIITNDREQDLHFFNNIIDEFKSSKA